MGKYSRFKYSRDFYGANPASLEFSIQPFRATVLDYGDVSGRVLLEWASPTGAFTAMRIVRNQNFFPESEEDGVVIFDISGNSTNASISSGKFEDKNSNAYTSFAFGRFSYYRAWLKKANNIWYPAGDTYVLIPSPHSTKTSRNTTRTSIEDALEGAIERNEYSNLELLSTHERFMDLLPRVYTSTDHTAIDEVDPSSELYRFLQPFSLTLDESLTYADLLKPDAAGSTTNPEILDLQANQLGIGLEPGVGSKIQKKMIREARYMYSRKGTTLGLGTAVESLSGFSPIISTSPNLLFTVQDSSFKNGVGFWTATSGAVLTAVDTQATTATETNAIDRSWVGQVVVSSANAKIENGTTSVFTRGVPVVEETAYSFTYYVKTSSGTGEVVPAVSWYDQFGNIIGSPEEGAGITATTTWAKDASAEVTSPVGAVYAAISIKFVDTATYYVDMVQLATDEAGPYYEARAVGVQLYPSKFNHITNPSFEDASSGSTTGWTIGGTATTEEGTLVSALSFPSATAASSAPYSEYQLSVVTPSASWEMSYDTTPGYAVAGSFYTFSIYCKKTSGTQVLQLKISADDGVVDPVEHTSEEFTVGTAWVRLQVTKYIPNTLNQTSMVITVSVLGTTAGGTLKFDAAQLENSYYASDYFDGSYGPLPGASWAGTAYASPSVLYPNKIQKIPNLIGEMASYLPINTPYIISTVGRVEYKSVT